MAVVNAVWTIKKGFIPMEITFMHIVLSSLLILSLGYCPGVLLGLNQRTHLPVINSFKPLAITFLLILKYSIFALIDMNCGANQG